MPALQSFTFLPSVITATDGPIAFFLRKPYREIVFLPLGDLSIKWPRLYAAYLSGRLLERNRANGS